jgi:hypothetical protein
MVGERVVDFPLSDVSVSGLVALFEAKSHSFLSTDRSSREVSHPSILRVAETETSKGAKRDGIQGWNFACSARNEIEYAWGIWQVNRDFGHTSQRHPRCTGYR